MKLRLILLFLWVPLWVFAQKDTIHADSHHGGWDTSLYLDDIQVVANRKLKDIGIERTQLDTLVLHDNISLSMGDILMKNSTLFIKSYGRATESTAEFRGTSPSHTQVVWNGLKLNSPMIGTVDFSTIPAYFIDEANLYHGASSTNLSSGGLGGAVEMLSKVPLENSLQYVQGFGSFDTFDQFLRLTYAGSRWAASTRVVYSTSKNRYKYTNYDKKTDVYDEDGNIVDSYHPEETNKSGYFDDVHALQEIYYNAGRGNKLGLNVWYAYSKRGLPFLSVDYKDDSDFKNEHKTNNLRSVLSWDQVKDAYKLAVKGGYAYSDAHYDYYTTHQSQQSDITKSENYTNTAFLKGDFDWYLSPKLMLTFGASVYYNHVKSADKSPFHSGENINKDRIDADANIQIRWRPYPIFSVAGLIREENHGDKFVPPIPALFADVILYKPWNLVFKASVARNYRFPSMEDLFSMPGGNKFLQAEKGFTYDGGLEWSMKHGSVFTFKGNVTAFDSYINDWIMWVPNVKGYWQPFNVKKVHNYGIETSVHGDVMLAKDLKLSLTANFAWTPSKNLGDLVDSNDASYGKQLCYVPERSANVNARIQWRTWTFVYQWTHYSERFTTTSNEVLFISGRIKPYYMSDISLEKSFTWRKCSASVKGVVNNLLSTEYVTVLSHPMPRRNFEIYLTIKL